MKTVETWADEIGAATGLNVHRLWNEAMADITTLSTQKERLEAAGALHRACHRAVIDANDHPDVIASFEKTMGPRAKWL